MKKNKIAFVVAVLSLVGAVLSGIIGNVEACGAWIISFSGWMGAAAQS
jgi:hypothetical protein